MENFYTMLPDRHPDYEQMKVWMETELNNARQNGEKVTVQLFTFCTFIAIELSCNILMFIYFY